MIPPKKNGCGIIWIVAILIVICVGGDKMTLFDPNVTVADLVVYIIAFFGALATICKYSLKLIYRNRPFSVAYQVKPPYLEFETFKHVELSRNNSVLYLRITPKRPQYFENIHVRLVNKKRWKKSEFPNREDVAIIDIKAEDLSENEKITTHNDSTNGLQGKFEPSFQRSPEQALVLHVYIKSTIRWSGYIVFRANSNTGHKKCVYLPLRIM